MKLLDEEQMVTLVLASPEDRSLLARRMAPVCDGVTAAWMEKAVHEGHYHIETICYRGLKVGIIWWWFSPGNKTLVLKAGASCVPTDTSAVFMAAYEILARRVGAEALEIQTRRPGVIKSYRANGFTVEAVCMRKILPQLKS